MISYVCREKELRQKELLKMMSVAENDIGWSWFVSYLIVYLVVATLCAITSMQLYTNSSGLILWIFWVFTFVAIVVFCLFIAALSAKTTRVRKVKDCVPGELVQYALVHPCVTDCVSPFSVR